MLHIALDTSTSESVTGRPTSTDDDQKVTLDLHLYWDVDGIHRTLSVYQHQRVTSACWRGVDMHHRHTNSVETTQSKLVAGCC